MTDAKKLTSKDDNFDFRKINDIIKETPITKVAPKSKENVIPPEKVNEIITRLANNFQIPQNASFVAIALLMLMGAANDGTPLTMSVEVDGKEITKKDLMYVYELVAKNRYLRRLAEAMAVEISTYAEKNGLSGDLARRLNTRSRSETGDNLTPKEMAWASSFCQNVTDLKDLSSERLCKLLAEDFNNRFAKNNKKQNSTAKAVDNNKAQESSDKAKKKPASTREPAPPAASQKKTRRAKPREDN